MSPTPPTPHQIGDGIMVRVAHIDAPTRETTVTWAPNEETITAQIRDDPIPQTVNSLSANGLAGMSHRDKTSETTEKENLRGYCVTSSTPDHNLYIEHCMYNVQDIDTI